MHSRKEIVAKWGIDVLRIFIHLKDVCSCYFYNILVLDKSPGMKICFDCGCSSFRNKTLSLWISKCSILSRCFNSSLVCVVIFAQWCFEQEVVFRFLTNKFHCFVTLKAMLRVLSTPKEANWKRYCSNKAGSVNCILRLLKDGFVFAFLLILQNTRGEHEKAIIKTVPMTLIRADKTRQIFGQERVAFPRITWQPFLHRKGICLPSHYKAEARMKFLTVRQPEQSLEDVGKSELRVL